MGIDRDKRRIKAKLENVKTRNGGDLNSTDPDILFEDKESIFYTDDSKDLICAFSRRFKPNKDKYFIWSLASSEVPPDADLLETMYRAGIREIHKIHGNIPFSAILNHHCPWVPERTKEGVQPLRKLMLDIKAGLEAVVPNSIIIKEPPEYLEVKTKQGSKVYGTVHCHTDPIHFNHDVIEIINERPPKPEPPRELTQGEKDSIAGKIPGNQFPVGRR